MIRDLEELERRYQRVFATGREDGLTVVGYGEITSVVAWPTSDGDFAVKRLPAFSTQDEARAYVELVETYIERLRRAGIQMMDTEAQQLTLDDGSIAVYLVQPLADAAMVGPRFLREAGHDDAVRLLRHTLDAIGIAIGAGIGFDGQLSNWIVGNPSPSYIDVTTPLLRDPDGNDLLDTDIFLASLPWALRGFVKRFLVRGIIDEYFDVRTTKLNLLAQFHKERLLPLLPVALDIANEGLAEPITRKEVDTYYRRDALMWESLQRLRQMDRYWHLRIKRRPYPFLLPGKISR